MRSWCGCSPKIPLVRVVDGHIRCKSRYLYTVHFIFPFNELGSPVMVRRHLCHQERGFLGHIHSHEKVLGYLGVASNVETDSISKRVLQHLLTKQRKPKPAGGQQNCVPSTHGLQRKKGDKGTGTKSCWGVIPCLPALSIKLGTNS
jgi:hypothetical protein